jgi:hypothetical protein
VFWLKLRAKLDLLGTIEEFSALVMAQPWCMPAFYWLGLIIDLLIGFIGISRQL